MIRTLLSIAMKNIKLGLAEVSEERLVAFDDVIAVRFIPVWKALSTEHRKALKAKITEVTRRALTSKEVKDFLGIIQQKRGYKITRNLDQSNKAQSNSSKNYNHKQL